MKLRLGCDFSNSFNLAKKMDLRGSKIFHYMYTAVCSPRCLNGGNCTAPGVCTCTTEWMGDTCEQGKIYHTDNLTREYMYVP